MSDTSCAEWRRYEFSLRKNTNPSIATTYLKYSVHFDQGRATAGTRTPCSLTVSCQEIRIIVRSDQISDLRHHTLSLPFPLSFPPVLPTACHIQSP